MKIFDIDEELWRLVEQKYVAYKIIPLNGDLYKVNSIVSDNNKTIYKAQRIKFNLELEEEKEIIKERNNE